MSSLELLKQITAVATIITGLTGCFVLHYRIRTNRSLSFLIAVIALCVWNASLQFLSGLLYASGTFLESRVLAVMHQADDIVNPAFSLLASICFVMAARDMRPNIFKPKPLRGSG